ncbi:hypothetical protein [Halobaculum sp. D14]|uniref:hypothetical protein n=1 Tax=unclassified Halobaculum TaxID=2640896 RepID=UPI003EB96625
MVSRENTVIVACIALAVVALFALAELTNPPTWAGGAVLVGLGVLLPLLVNGYLDRRDGEP